IEPATSRSCKRGGRPTRAVTGAGAATGRRTCSTASTATATTCSASPPTSEFRSRTTSPSATFAWSSSDRRSPVACARPLAQPPSARCAVTCPPPPNTVARRSPYSASSTKVSRGYQQQESAEQSLSDDLVERHPAAFADHAAEFWL